jgi:hypothetical protein
LLCLSRIRTVNVRIACNEGSPFTQFTIGSAMKVASFVLCTRSTNATEHESAPQFTVAATPMPAATSFSYVRGDDEAEPHPAAPASAADIRTTARARRSALLQAGLVAASS